MVSRSSSERSTNTVRSREPPGSGVPYGLVSNVALELAILNHDQVRIEEHLFRHFKADAMLREIAFRFLRVSGEFNFHPLSL